MKMLGASVMFLGIDEDELTEELLEEKLNPLIADDVRLIAPEYEIDGNPHHNIVAIVAKRLDWGTQTYKTYTGLEDFAPEATVNVFVHYVKTTTTVQLFLDEKFQ